MTLAKGRMVSGVEMIFIFWAIEQVSKPLRKLRNPSHCRLCKKEIPSGEMAFGNGGSRWHEMCALGVACQIEKGVDAILACGHYRVLKQTASKIVIRPVREMA